VGTPPPPPSSARHWYEKNIKSDNLDAVLQRAGQYLKGELITSEVFVMLQAIKQ